MTTTPTPSLPTPPENNGINWTDDDLERVASEMLHLDEDDAPTGTILDSTLTDDDIDDLADHAPGEDDGDDDSGALTDDGTDTITDGGGGDSGPSPDLPSPSSDTDITPALSPETLLTYAQFDAVLKNRPDALQFFKDMLDGNDPVAAAAAHVPPPVPTPLIPDLPTLDDDDLADPAIRALYEHSQATAQALAAATSRVDQLTNVTVIRNQQEFTTRALEAKAAFATEHNIDPAKVDEIARHADAMGLSQALLPNATDPYAAVTRVLDTAYWSMPEFRTQELENAVKDRTQRNRKRQKLAAVGGGGGVAPRDTGNSPMTDMQRRDAMIKDVAEQWFGTTQPVE